MAKHHPDLIFCRKQAGVGKALYLVDLDWLKALNTWIIMWCSCLTNKRIAKQGSECSQALTHEWMVVLRLKWEVIKLFMKATLNLSPWLS